MVVANPDGQTGRMTGAFTYECGLAAPTGLRTTSITSGGNLLLFVLWDTVPGASSYVFEIGTAPGTTTFTQEVQPSASGGGATVIGAGTTPATLTFVRGNSYYLRVRSKGACGLGPTSVELRRDYF